MPGRLTQINSRVRRARYIGSMDLFLGHCAALFSSHGGLFAVFFMGGLVGGFTHCLAMCGPMVVGQSLGCARACAGSCSKSARASQVIGLPYHVGRMVSYGALGFLAALFSKQIAASPHWPVVSAIMLALAGLMFLASSLPGCHHRFSGKASQMTFLRGALLGFMPCGLIYAALMMAATLADPLRGMVAMWLFVLGTMPALLLPSASAAFFTTKWRNGMGYAGRAIMAFNGLSLLVMAEHLVR